MKVFLRITIVILLVYSLLMLLAGSFFDFFIQSPESHSWGILTKRVVPSMIAVVAICYVIIVLLKKK